MTIPRIDGFDISSWVRENSAGTFWLAHQRALDRPVHLLILRDDGDPAHTETIREAAHLAARVNQRGLVDVIDVARTPDGIDYIVLDAFEGPSLRDLLAADGPIPEARLVSIAHSIAGTLSRAWASHRFVHRNLKPEELFLLSDGSVHIAGFTSCTFVGDDGLLADRSGEIVGTVTYMPPEQAAVRPTVDMRADMYTLGAVLYHLGTGHVPFGEYASDPQHLLAMLDVVGLPPPRELNPALSAGFEAVLARLLMKDPQDRYSSWGGLLQDLDSLAVGADPALARAFIPQGRSTFVAPAEEPPAALPSAVPSPTPTPAPAPTPAPPPPVPPEPAVSPADGKAETESEVEPAARREPERADTASHLSTILWLLLLIALGALAVWRWNHPDVEPTVETFAALVEGRQQPEAEVEDIPPVDDDELIPFSQP